MGIQFAAARAVSAVSTWGLKNVFHRPAANFPGKMALYVDPRLIADLRPKLRTGSFVVVGTNGKTTVTNLLADILEQAGQRVVCNRTGANLDSGVATALLHAKPSDWGVFESDELWLAKILPHLQASYVVLLNLFRDQLDRVGEIDRIQDSIARALETSPDTVLLYNADDPLCAAIAARVGNASVAFGLSESMGLPQNTVADAQMCQQCSSMMEYEYRQYGQLGAYRCPSCGFARPALDYAAEGVRLGTDGLGFDVVRAADGDAGNVAPGGEGRFATEDEGRFSTEGEEGAAAESRENAAFEGAKSAVPVLSVKAPYTGAYMVYNLLATAAAADLAGCPADAVGRAIDCFDPQNGRLQTFDIAGRRVLLNLAKNPTGFNQNLKIVAQDPNPKVVAFFVNDKEGDGRDVSWLWDIDFEELAEVGAMTVFSGGIRGNDVQVRLKYADIPSVVVSDADDLLARIASVPKGQNAYFIANYTALPSVHAALTAAAAAADGATASVPAPAPDSAPAPGSASASGSTLASDSAPASGGASVSGGAPASGSTPVSASDAPALDAAGGFGSGRPSSSPTGDRADSSSVAAPVAAPASCSTVSQEPGLPFSEEGSVPAVSCISTASAAPTAPDPVPANGVPADVAPAPAAIPRVVIAHLFPDLLNLYGDGGNVRILAQRLRWRGIPVEVRRASHGESIDLAGVDLVFLGGGPDREQRLASSELMRMRDELRAYVEDGGVLLAICGGYQILGREWLLGDEVVEGLGIVDITTERAAGGSADRLIDNIVLRSPLATLPVVGYENHAGRTRLGTGVEAFGSVASSTGHGNNEVDKADGVRYKNLVGTYLHGPLLAKNPEVADHLLARALERSAARSGVAAPTLAPLDDSVEKGANEALCKRFGAR